MPRQSLWGTDKNIDVGLWGETAELMDLWGIWTWERICGADLALDLRE